MRVKFSVRVRVGFGLGFSTPRLQTRRVLGSLIREREHASADSAIATRGYERALRLRGANAYGVCVSE